MEIPRAHYTEEFKQETVKLVRESGLMSAHCRGQNDGWTFWPT